MNPCTVCGMVLLPSGGFETSYNRAGGTATNLPKELAWSRVCRFHNNPACINSVKLAPVEKLPEGMPTTEDWMDRSSQLIEKLKENP